MLAGGRDQRKRYLGTQRQATASVEQRQGNERGSRQASRQEPIIQRECALHKPVDDTCESATGSSELGIPPAAQQGEDPQREVQPVEEVARIETHRQAGQQIWKVLEPVTPEMAVALVIARP
jgi:hypothetical protein